MMLVKVAMVLGAYLLGSLPVLYLLGRLRGFDLSEEEDLHMALWRKVGRLEGTLGVVWDMGRGAFAVLAARSLGFELPVVAMAGLAAVAGQMWPVFEYFDGEKGNSTGIAMAFALAQKPFAIAIIPILVGVTIRTAPRLLASGQSASERLKFGGPPSRSLPLGIALSFAVLPFASWWLSESETVTLANLTLFLLIMARRLTADLRRDLRGASNKRSILINRLLYDRSYL